MTLEFLAIVPIAAATLIATSMDNLLLLIALLSRPGGGRPAVLIGYLGAMGVLIALCYLLGRFATLIPSGWLGYLGVVPLCMGIAGVARILRRPQPGGRAAQQRGGDEGGLARGGAVAAAGGTALVQLSNSVDTLVTVSVLFAESSVLADLLMVVTLGVVAVLFAGAALLLVRQPRLGGLLQWIGRYVTPVILILIGVYVLLDTATDVEVALPVDGAVAVERVAGSARVARSPGVAPALQIP